MPLIPKPNYNQIFASQAPDIDKPAVFNNYPEGWGPESRPNNGKPTIKGFNYLQQTSDLKDLWILQNGACLPYDESIEYADGAPVLKDGVIQYKAGSGFKSRDSVTIPTYGSAADGVDPVTGVADGAYYNVRSTEDDSFLVEYQNIGGIPTPSGKSYPSSDYVRAVKEAIIDPTTNKATATKVFDAIANVNQQLINNSRLTVDNFGAKGDKITDDSAAFQAYIDSALTPMNVYLGHRQAVYRIAKQVDFKGKGLVGHGFSRQHTDVYNHSSLYIAGDGDFYNATSHLNNTALINVGADIRNLQLYGNNDCDSLNGIHLSTAYNVTISNVNIRGFYNQIYVHSATVSFRVSDFTSISCKNAGFYFADSENVQSTTAYFTRCSWQWGKCPVKFDKEVYGASFRDIVIEYMEEGLTAKIWSNCVFDNIWAERTLNNEPADWLVNTMHQQTPNNQYSNLYIRSPWTNRANPDAIPSSNGIGGVTIENSQVAVSGLTGSKIVFYTRGLKTRFADYYGESNNPKGNRRLSLSTQATADGSNYRTPITIDAPNGCLYLRNLDDDDYTPVTLRTIIGANAANNNALYGVDTYTQTMRRWSTQENGSGNTGNFYAPMMLTYHSLVSTQQSNNGWIVRRESVGSYIIERVSGNTNQLVRPHVIVSGVTVGAGLGSLTPTFNIVQWINSYTNSWTVDGIAAGFRVVFKDMAGELIDVQRFTVAFTSGR